MNLLVVQDDLTCRVLGWSFLDHKENNLTFGYKALSRQAWISSFSSIPFMQSSNWCLDTCSAYLKAGTQLTKSIYAAFHLTAGLPGRGTETTSIWLSNTKLAIRHIFVQEG